MILLNPIWLFALAALSIPVAIHLWNIRQGKPLKIGSIALINASFQKSSRSFKLHNLLLLLLRCLLLALVAFVLTMPLWQKHINSVKTKGWVLIPKENIKETFRKFKPEIDSLTKVGYEFHYFNKGFQKMALNEALADNQIDSTHSASYWNLIQQLDSQVPSSLPVYLFTPNRVTHFNGAKPQITLNLHWQVYTPADSISTWIENAWLTNNNDIKIVQGNSTSGRTYYTNYTVQSGNQHNTPFTSNTDNGRLTIGLRNANAVNADTSTWRFAIYAEKNTNEVGYVKAALESVIQFARHKASIKQYADAAQIPPHQNWIFWLSPKSVSKQEIQNCNNLFINVSGEVKDISSWIDDQSGSLSTQKIVLYKRILANSNDEEALWSDGFGNPLLSFERQQQANIYHFYSRFDPLWSDLVWSDDFPKMLLKLIIDQPSKPDEKYDRRVVDITQLLPAAINEAHKSTGKIIEPIDFTLYGWLLLVMVFITERWLAHKKAGKQILQHG
jgi:hypothetical protein